MLRRKLLLILGPLVLLLLLTAVVEIWLLQGVLEDLKHIKESASVMVEDVNDLSITINAIEVHLYELQTGKDRHLDNLVDAVDSARKLCDRLSTSYLCISPPGNSIYKRIAERLPDFERHVGALATAQDHDLIRQHNEAALAAAVAMREDTLPLSRLVRDHAQQEQQHLLIWFRWLVLGMGLVFLLVINIAVVVLLRAAGMILKPVDQLVAATRELAEEHYDYRVQLGRSDEFGQLAEAYNHLAEQLQSNDKRRMEVLQQVALAMNHEINNSISIIDLQLRLLSRQTGSNAAMARPLREIQDSLSRMTRTVQALKNARRIVLTDYVSGVKMLDLERSACEEQGSPQIQPISET